MSRFAQDADQREETARALALMLERGPLSGVELFGDAWRKLFWPSALMRRLHKDGLIARTKPNPLRGIMARWGATPRLAELMRSDDPTVLERLIWPSRGRLDGPAEPGPEPGGLPTEPEEVEPDETDDDEDGPAPSLTEMVAGTLQIVHALAASQEAVLQRLASIEAELVKLGKAWE